MKTPSHIAFIMDGNRRWARENNLSTTDGHYHGLKAMKEIIKECIKREIKNISFFCFSIENWKRNEHEIQFLMKLIAREINNTRFEDWLINNNVKLVWNGTEDNLNSKLIQKIKNLMLLTANNNRTKLQLCFNYGSQQKIVETINDIKKTKNKITMECFWTFLDRHQMGPVDLLIRTSGEKRISNFLLFEIAYAEIIFNKKYWPDYKAEDFENDLQEFYRRQRRYGS